MAWDNAFVASEFVRYFDRAEGLFRRAAPRAYRSTKPRNSAQTSFKARETARGLCWTEAVPKSRFPLFRFLPVLAYGQRSIQFRQFIHIQ